jgi:hypothetical protein
MSIIGHWETTLCVEGFGDCELEVQMKGTVFSEGDGGIDVDAFEWTLEGAEIPEPAATTLADHWHLEEKFLEDVWENLYRQGSIKVGKLYRLKKPGSWNLPVTVKVLAVCKQRNEIRWDVVVEDQRFPRPGHTGIHLMPVDDFYLPGYAVLEDDDGPRYKLVED